MEDLERFDTWRKALEFTLAVYKRALPCLPVEEKYGLSQQLRRAAQSIPANLAEGHGRYYYQDGIRFCYIARGSLEETVSHLILAKEVGYLPEESFMSLHVLARDLSRMINGYISYLKRTRQGDLEKGNHTVKESLEPLDQYTTELNRSVEE